MQAPKTSVVILAGGKSERMGFPKPFLAFDEKRTFLKKITEEYTYFGCNSIVVVLNKDLFVDRNRKYIESISGNIKVILNDSPELGRFYSLKLGLSAIDNTSYCFLQDIDNPFINRDLLKTIYQNKIDFGYTVPYYINVSADIEIKIKGHPILLSNMVVDEIKNIPNNYLSIKDVLKQFLKRLIEVSDKNILVNINTQAEYKSLFDSEPHEPEELFSCS